MNKKILILGLVTGGLMLVVGLVTNWFWGVLFPALSEEYQNPNLFRPWSDPLMSYIFVHPFVLGVILSWIWDKTKNLFKKQDIFWRCCQFALAYFLVTIPGMLMTYSSFRVSLTMVFIWSLTGMIQVIVAGWIFAQKNP